MLGNTNHTATKPINLMYRMSFECNLFGAQKSIGIENLHDCCYRLRSSQKVQFTFLVERMLIEIMAETKHVHVRCFWRDIDLINASLNHKITARMLPKTYVDV